MPTLADLLQGLQSDPAGRYAGLGRLAGHPAAVAPPLPFGSTQPAGPDPMGQGMTLLGLLGGGVSGVGGSGGPGSGSGAGIGPSSGAGVNVLQPGSPLLDTRRGVTLQGGALQSLLDIARQSDVMPGTRELRQISDSYRSPQQQADAYASKPGIAAAPGHSYHQAGLAIDASWWSSHPELRRLLERAGWNRFSPGSEPWHWSYKVTG